MELDMDFLKSLISDFDLMALLPDMAAVMEWIFSLVGMAVIIGPALLALLGLINLILPAKEANHFMGYRCFWGMGSIKSWKFTQRFSGAVWAVMGIVMALSAYHQRSELLSMGDLNMMYRAVEMLIDQIVAVVISCVVINIIIFILFDFKGNIRRIWKNLVDTIRNAMEKSKQNKVERRPRRNPNENK